MCMNVQVYFCFPFFPFIDIIVRICVYAYLCMLLYVCVCFWFSMSGHVCLCVLIFVCVSLYVSALLCFSMSVCVCECVSSPSYLPKVCPYEEACSAGVGTPISASSLLM